MTLRKRIIFLIEADFTNDTIISTFNDKGYSDEEIIEALKNECIIEPGTGTTKEIWLDNALNNLREKIESNNKIFKDISIHDIISSREHTMQQNVNLSNELYHLKTYVKQLENDKIDLQIKLERVRNCDTRKNVYCYECEDSNCVNNIYYSLRKEK